MLSPAYYNFLPLCNSHPIYTRKNSNKLKRNLKDIKRLFSYLPLPEGHLDFYTEILNWSKTENENYEDND